MKSLALKSPAKINLSLSIIRRLPNGYHELVTLFHRLSLFDTLTFKKIRSGFELKTNHPRLEVDERNLITRAWRLLQSENPTLDGLKVFLKKNIPLGSGLGGGSSNAAFFLLGVNHLFNLRITQKELMKMGSKLGADVPFFILNETTAAGFSKGDKLSRISLKKKLWFVLLLSSNPLSTQVVYQNLPEKLPAVSFQKEKANIKKLVQSLNKHKSNTIGKFLKNDLQAPAFKLRNDIEKVIRICEKVGAEHIQMSGSGPTIFALFETKKQAEQFLKKKKFLLRRGWKALICSSF